MTTIFSDGFESGNLNAWTGTRSAGSGVSLSVQTSVVRQGTYGMQAAIATGSGENGYNVYKDLGSTYSTVYARIYARVSAMPATGSDLELFGFTSDGWIANALGTRVDIVNNSGTLQWRVYYYNNGWNGQNIGNISLNTWYCIEVKLVMGSGSGETRLYIDGSEVVTHTGLNNAGSVRYFCLGIDDETGNNTTDVFADCAVVADTYIGMLDSNDLTVTGNLTVEGNATLNNTLDVSGIINSHASGSNPVAGSNAGMILDCYTPTHQDGLGIQSGGIWLKYDNNFNIYYDSGSSILTALALNTNGDATIAGAYRSNVSSSAPGPHTNDGLKIDLWPAAHSDGIGMQNGGMWLKYGSIFDIYYDSGTAITDALHLDSSGNAIFSGQVTTGLAGLQIGNGTISWNDTYLYGFVFTPPIEFQNDVQFDYVQTFYDTGNYLYYSNGGTSVQNKTPASRNSYIHVFCSTVSPYDQTTVQNPFLYVDQSIFAENDIQTFGVLSSLSDPQKLAANPSRGGGGALILGHGYTNPSVDQPIILLADAQSNFNTVWLKAAPPTNEPLAQNWPWGNLALGSLTFNQGNNAQVTLNTGYTTELGYNIAFIMPSVAPVLSGGNWLGGAGLGTTNYFWNYVDSAYYFAKYTSIIQFDALDDLALVKKSKGKQVGDKQVIDLDSLPHLRPDSTDKTDEIDIGKAIGFSIGCHKASALKHDEHDATIANLLTRIEKLEGMLKEKLQA